MTPHQIALGIDGFLQKQEIQGNIMLMAINYALEGKGKVIKLTQQNGKSNTSINKSTIEERNKTFEALGISQEV